MSLVLFLPTERERERERTEEENVRYTCILDAPSAEKRAHPDGIFLCICEGLSLLLFLSCTGGGVYALLLLLCSTGLRCARDAPTSA